MVLLESLRALPLKLLLRHCKHCTVLVFNDFNQKLGETCCNEEGTYTKDPIGALLNKLDMSSNFV